MGPAAQERRRLKTIDITLAAVATGSIALGSWGAVQRTTPQRPPVVLSMQDVPVSIPIIKVARKATKTADARQIGCVASTIWYEAEDQPREGRIAVAEVVMTRARSRLYPSKPCAIIQQRGQFSFVNDGVVPRVPKEHVQEMTRLAVAVMEGRIASRFRGAISFHATYVSPKWKLPRLGRIGQHVFYAPSTRDI